MLIPKVIQRVGFYLIFFNKNVGGSNVLFKGQIMTYEKHSKLPYYDRYKSSELKPPDGLKQGNP